MSEARVLQPYTLNPKPYILNPDIRYKLKHHCEAIKKFILFGQGDFVRHLMDLLVDNVRPGRTPGT